MNDTGWFAVGRINDIPRRGARVVRTSAGDFAVFRTLDDHVFALPNRCPHRGGPLSEGIVHGHSVTCPLHNWVIDLETGMAQGADIGCAGSVRVRLEPDGTILMDRAVDALAAAAE